MHPTVLQCYLGHDFQVYGIMARTKTHEELSFSKKMDCTEDEFSWNRISWTHAAEKSTATFLVVKSISTKSTHYFGCEDMKVLKSAFRYGREDTTW